MRSKIRLIMLIFLIIIIGVGASAYIYLNTSKYLIKLNKDEFVYELGEKISSNVLDYAEIPNKYHNDTKISCSNLKIKDDYFVMEDSEIIPIGKYECELEIKKKSYKFTLSVEDTISPEFTKFKEIIELEQTTDNVDLLSYFAAKDYSKVSLKIVGDYDLNKVNKYELKIIATDEANNYNESNFTLNIKEKKKIENKQNIPTQNSGNSSKSTTSSNNQQSSNSPASNNNSNTQAFTGYRKDISNSYVIQVNQYRKAKGLSELPVTSETQSEADRRAKELVSNYSHDGAGYGFGEVIGNGTSGGDFITAWKNSPTHNATLLREENTAIAASVYEINGYWYTVISFKMNY